MAAVAAGSWTSASALPPAIRAALAVEPNRRTGTIQDVEHVVILMQENRSFDHYFGTLRGVRGFGDPRPARLPNGHPVWRQPAATEKTKHYRDRGLSPEASFVLPFYINPQATTERQAGTDHGWSSGHLAWNNGHWNQWVTQKQDVLTMGYLRREDVSFHFALAEAFTLCDAYHCSIHADTCPNRIYLWSGTIDPRNVYGRKANGPGLEERGGTNGYTWTTYPERLEQHGISWKVYQGGTGEPGTPTDNYTDNSLEFFAAYQVKEGADPESALVQKGVTNRTLRELRDDVVNNRLAQVTWVVAPYIYSEHPEASPTDGAYYVHTVLEALTANPDVWSKTVLFLNYDENDGLFDHIVPPMPPLTSAAGGEGMVSTSLEESLHDEILNLELYPHEAHPLVPGADPLGRQPIGLGPRVPMIIVSPWTRGGWVCSQVFDHTSVLQFLETRFGVPEPNISAWRRSICGDLTSAFDFASAPQTAVPKFTVPAPVQSLHQPYQVPAEQTMPQQEQGVRPARALPYQFQIHGAADAEQKRFQLTFVNSGHAGAAFYVYDGVAPHTPPRRYAVAAGDSLGDYWAIASESGEYDLAASGPNGYLCHLRGRLQGQHEASPEAKLAYDPASKNVVLTITNTGQQGCTVAVANAYVQQEKPRMHELAAGAVVEDRWRVAAASGWYDLSITMHGNDALNFLRRFAGHMEDGKPSTSDPLLSPA